MRFTLQCCDGSITLSETLAQQCHLCLGLSGQDPVTLPAPNCSVALILACQAALDNSWPTSPATLLAMVPVLDWLGADELYQQLLVQLLASRPPLAEVDALSDDQRADLDSVVKRARILVPVYQLEMVGDDLAAAHPSIHVDAATGLIHYYEEGKLVSRALAEWHPYLATSPTEHMRELLFDEAWVAQPTIFGVTKEGHTAAVESVRMTNRLVVRVYDLQADHLIHQGDGFPDGDHRLPYPIDGEGSYGCGSYCRNGKCRLEAGPYQREMDVLAHRDLKSLLHSTDRYVLTTRHGTVWLTDVAGTADLPLPAWHRARDDHLLWRQPLGDQLVYYWMSLTELCKRNAVPAEWEPIWTTPSECRYRYHYYDGQGLTMGLGERQIVRWMPAQSYAQLVR